MTAFTIRMDWSDVARLALNMMAWGEGWKVHPGRFQPVESPTWIDTYVPSMMWRTIYWFATYGDVILVRSFLMTQGEKFEIVTDENESGGYAILVTRK